MGKTRPGMGFDITVADLVSAASTDILAGFLDPLDHLKLSKSAFFHLARRGDVPGPKIGRHWRFHRAAIDRWLGQKREQKGRG